MASCSFSSASVEVASARLAVRSFPDPGADWLRGRQLWGSAASRTVRLAERLVFPGNVEYLFRSNFLDTLLFASQVGFVGRRLRTAEVAFGETGLDSTFRLRFFR